MTSDTVILSIAAAIAVTVATPGLRAGAGLTVGQVRNSNACLPSLADPPDLIVPFKDGKYVSPSIPFAEMRAVASGELDGKPAVVSEIVWNTGGSGNWEIVALFRESTGQAINQGVYWPAPDLPDGGTMVGRIEIKDNTIRLYGEDPAASQNYRYTPRHHDVSFHSLPDLRESLTPPRVRSSIWPRRIKSSYECVQVSRRMLP